jgi:CdiI immunity protein
MYFGQDFFDDYDDNEQLAIDDFIRRTNEAHRCGTLAELDLIRAKAESPEALERDLHYLAWSYRPPGHPTPYRDFADRLADRIRASLD